MAEKIRILLVDDHPMVRKGLAVMILESSDLELVGEAPDGETALSLYFQLHPDVVLMDAMMPNLSGVQALEAIKQRDPNARVIIITSFNDPELVQNAVRAGALGFLYKNIPVDELEAAVRMVYQGRPVLAPEALQALVRVPANVKSERHETRPGDLSPRELEILRLLGEGCSNKQIALRLGITENTVKKYLSIVFSKLGVSNRAEAITLAMKKKLL